MSLNNFLNIDLVNSNTTYYIVEKINFSFQHGNIFPCEKPTTLIGSVGSNIGKS